MPKALAIPDDIQAVTGQATPITPQGQAGWLAKALPYALQLARAQLTSNRFFQVWKVCSLVPILRQSSAAGVPCSTWRIA